MNAEAELVSSFPPVLLSVIGLLFLFFGWYLFKLGIHSIGFLAGFSLSLLFVFLLGMTNLLVEIIVILLLGAVLGYIFSRGLWLIHKYILALLGLLTSLLVNYWFQIPSLFESESMGLLYIIVISILTMALFIFAEKYLIIIFSSLIGSVLIHRFIILEWDLAQRLYMWHTTYFDTLEIDIQWISLFLFCLCLLTGLIAQTSLLKARKKYEYQRNTER